MPRHPRGRGSPARFACIADVAAAIISLAQFVLGMVLAGAAAPGTAHLLYEAVNRLDGSRCSRWPPSAWPALRRGCCPGGCALLAVLPAAVFLYFFYRDGEQVIGGLDPNFTVNAWGGPTYIGAMACHYIGGLVLMGAAAWLLDRILLPGQPTAPSDGDAPGDALDRHASNCGSP